MNKNSLLVIVCLGLTACGQAMNNYHPQSYWGEMEPSPSRQFEVQKIDSALEGLEQQYIDAGRAVSVNEAEQVYLQRFTNDLQQKRQEVLCRDSIRQPDCP